MKWRWYAIGFWCPIHRDYWRSDLRTPAVPEFNLRRYLSWAKGRSLSTSHPCGAGHVNDVIMEIEL